MNNAFPKCNDRRECFARNGKICTILLKTYERTGQCPFCKEKKGRRKDGDRNM